MEVDIVNQSRNKLTRFVAAKSCPPEITVIKVDPAELCRGEFDCLKVTSLCRRISQDCSMKITTGEI
jgi:hypothetical protein